MALCERCRCDLLALDYPPEIDVVTHRIQLLDGSARRLQSQVFEVIGILWSRRDIYVHVERLRTLMFGNTERSENGPRNAVYNARRELRGSAYEILHSHKIGYRIVNRTMKHTEVDDNPRNRSLQHQILTM